MWSRSARGTSKAEPLASQGEELASSNPFADADPFTTPDRNQVVERVLAEYRGGSAPASSGAAAAAAAGQSRLQNVPLYETGSTRGTTNGAAATDPLDAGAAASAAPQYGSWGHPTNPFLPREQPATATALARTSAATSTSESGSAAGAWPASKAPAAQLPTPQPAQKQRDGSSWQAKLTPAAFHISGPAASKSKSQSKVSEEAAEDGVGGGSFGRLWNKNAGPPTVAAPQTREWQAREQDLLRSEAELKMREADIARREAALRAGGAAVNKPKNWPRLPFFPRLVHHDIGGEVPWQRQALVKLAYITWCIIATAYLYNWLIITIMFAAGQKTVALWLFASLVAGFGLPLSFLCWYRSLYKASISDSAFTWGWFFLHMLANIVWDWWMFVGIEPKIGGYSAGLFTMIEQFSHGGGKGVAFGVLSIFNMILWGLGGLLSLGIISRALFVFRRRPLAGPTAPQPAGGSRTRTTGSSRPGLAGAV